MYRWLTYTEKKVNICENKWVSRNEGDWCYSTRPWANSEASPGS